MMSLPIIEAVPSCHRIRLFYSSHSSAQIDHEMPLIAETISRPECSPGERVCAMSQVCRVRRALC